MDRSCALHETRSFLCISAPRRWYFGIEFSFVAIDKYKFITLLRLSSQGWGHCSFTTLEFTKKKIHS